MTSNFVLCLLVAFCGQSLAGLLNSFSADSDYTAAFLMDSMFGLFTNDSKYIMNGGFTNPIEVDVTFLCGNRNVPTLVPTTINDGGLGSKIDTSKPLVLIIHGWLDNSKRNWIKQMTADYFQFVDTNLCVVDWSNLAIHGYALSVNRTYAVGDYVAEFVSYLNGQGIPLSKVTLVGHSLGAQISGQVGMRLGGQVGAIYGLDPASPLFKMPFDVGTSKRLDKSDAQYVQMIITSRCTLGVCVGDGHENFYPTGGMVPQPNCVVPMFSNAETPELISCSHAHACTLYRMALNPKNVFNGKKCFGYSAFLSMACLFNPTSKMGLYSRRIGGNFYLMTSAIPPYTV
ncbi:pancreatic triacylglycerol lipase-like [Culex pipiens pallens]|uniref:pancreatic triacylglycerol lipase-like n=1 Tax=Culex pipiens pallens TaxID=42434 RepID=UPI0019536C74|nr:pancreatic triacylglycerol lipase-like [Culex pipiens pallens]